MAKLKDFLKYSTIATVPVVSYFLPSDEETQKKQHQKSQGSQVVEGYEDNRENSVEAPFTYSNGKVTYGGNSDFIQGKNGLIYDRQGKVIGDVSRILKGTPFTNIFAYNAYRVLGKNATPEKVKQVQKYLGIPEDGKWGVITQAAHEAKLREEINK